MIRTRTKLSHSCFSSFSSYISISISQSCFSLGALLLRLYLLSVLWSRFILIFLSSISATEFALLLFPQFPSDIVLQNKLQWKEKSTLLMVSILICNAVMVRNFLVLRPFLSTFFELKKLFFYFRFCSFRGSSIHFWVMGSILRWPWLACCLEAWMLFVICLLGYFLPARSFKCSNIRKSAIFLRLIFPLDLAWLNDFLTMVSCKLFHFLCIVWLCASCKEPHMFNMYHHYLHNCSNLSLVKLL